MIQLIKGDCFDVMSVMIDKSVDISFTSPPYNRKRNDKYENYSDTIDDYYSFLKNTIDELLRVTKKYVFLNLQTNYYNKSDVYKIIGDYSDVIQNIIVWEKVNPLPASGNNITNSYELFLVLGDKPLKSNSTYTKNHISTSVYSENPYKKIHRAVMKPEIAEWFIDNFTQEEDVILDCFMGVGTTGVHCKMKNRSFIGIELNKEYYNIAKNRIEES